MKKYSIIYADPPWSYNDKRTGAGKNNPNGAGGALKHYSTMTRGDFDKMANWVREISDKDSILFLWATAPMLEEATWLINQWGFDYKTVGFVWVKMKNDMSAPRGDGIGNYTLNNAEFCLIGRKGKYWRKSAIPKQIVLAPKEEHSKKPDEVRKRIVELMGELPRIELFAREKTEGWDVWGNEVENDVDFTSLIEK